MSANTANRLLEDLIARELGTKPKRVYYRGGSDYGVGIRQKSPEEFDREVAAMPSPIPPSPRPAPNFFMRGRKLYASDHVARLSREERKALLQEWLSAHPGDRRGVESWSSGGNRQVRQSPGSSTKQVVQVPRETPPEPKRWSPTPPKPKSPPRDPFEWLKTIKVPLSTMPGAGPSYIPGERDEYGRLKPLHPNKEKGWPKGVPAPWDDTRPGESDFDAGMRPAGDFMRDFILPGKAFGILRASRVAKAAERIRRMEEAAEGAARESAKFKRSVTTSARYRRMKYAETEDLIKRRIEEEKRREFYDRMAKDILRESIESRFGKR